MSANFSKLRGFIRKNKWLQTLAIVVWVFVGTIVSMVLVSLLSLVLPDLADNPILNLALSAGIYVLSFAVVVGLPWLIGHFRTTRQEIGFTRSPSWIDIGLAPAGFVIYMVLSAILLQTATRYFPGIDIDQAQDVGFSGISQYYEYILAFITLVVLPPLAEELLFRGYLYGKLRRVSSVAVSVLLTSLVFGLVHMQWNVGIDTFALSLVLCVLREMTGSIWSSILLHMLKNGLAFFILFIYPLL